MTVSIGPTLSDALKKSPILSGEDMGGMGGSGFDFIDANQDPDLALALRLALFGVLLFILSLCTFCHCATFVIVQLLSLAN